MRVSSVVCVSSVPLASVLEANMPPKLLKPPKCCACNSSGTCRNCSCYRHGWTSTDCVPGKHGRCINLPGRNSTTTRRTSLSGLSSSSGIPAPSSSSVPSSFSGLLSSFSSVSCPPSQEKPRAARTTSRAGDNATSACGHNVGDTGSVRAGAVVASGDSENRGRSNDVGTCEAGIFDNETNESGPWPRTQDVDFGVNIGADDRPVVRPAFPVFQPVSDPSNFTWGDLDGKTFCDLIAAAYSEVVHWRRNLFLVPSGRAGKAFVTELARLWESYANASALEIIALPAATVMCALLLQKPHVGSKARDHSVCLERRLVSWSKGRIDELIAEGRTIQGRLRCTKRRSPVETTRTFTHLMLQGRVKSAMRVISDSPGGGLLDLDTVVTESKTVREVLREKHPAAMDASFDSLLAETEGPQAPHPVMFACLTGTSIKAAALRTFGGAGPSGVDAAGWRRLCCSFHKASKSLCDALAAVARRIATVYVDPKGIAAFTACRLCPLDKCPGVRPIGISEVPRRIIGKAIMEVVGKDVQNAAGSLQLSAGQVAGSETAVHAMRELFNDDVSEGVLLVDAKNAFNSLNRKAALWNIKVLCPSIAPAVINTYREDAELFVGGEKIYSCEGTTQGDPLSMAIYAVAIAPLVQRVSGSGAKQVWFADDAAGSGKLRKLRQWWDALVEHGPAFGYFANEEKTWLIVKEQHFKDAQQIFAGTGVNITIEGKRHLGGALGTPEFVTTYVNQQVGKWVEDINRLSTIARSQPQCAYAAFRRSLSSRWNYLSRTIPGVRELLMPVEQAIRQKFIPALTGREIPGDMERDLFALPTRLGGLGITNPVEMSDGQFDASKRITAPLMALVVQQEAFLGEVREEAEKTRQLIRSERRLEQARAAEHLRERLSPNFQRCMDLAKEKGGSSWLEALPVQEHQFNLSKNEFRDGLCLRYGWTPDRLPATCVCGSTFDVAHAMSCPTGGLPSIRHNEMRDLLAHTMSDVCMDVTIEPQLEESGEHQSVHDEESRGIVEHLRLDIRARGFWGGSLEVALFDVRVFNPFAPSAVNTPIEQLYRRNEAEKRRKYEARATADNCSFTPLIFSTTGGCSTLTSRFLKKLASKLTEKKTSSYSQALCWLRTRLSFSLLRSAVMCLRSSRRRPINRFVEPAAALSAAGLL